MTLARPTRVRALLRELGLRPSKSLGQNFLIDGNILGILVGEAELGPEDTVLEVGPGLGVLTEQLLARAGRVVAIEKDRRLFEHLQRSLEATTSLQLLHADALDCDVPALLNKGIHKLVANLPYSAGTRILVECAGAEACPQRMVVTVQRDVAERLCAQPDTRAYGAVTVMVQSRYDVRMVKQVKPTCFFPAPDVVSSIVTLERKTTPLDAGLPRKAFEAFVKRSFQQRRKQLAGNMAPLTKEDAGRLLVEVGQKATARAEDLSIEQWVALFREAG